MATNQIQQNGEIRHGRWSGRPARQRIVALILALFVGFLLGSPMVAGAEDALPETTGGEATVADPAPEEKTEAVEPAASEESPPTTAAPETTPATVPASEPDLRHTGDGGVVSSDARTEELQQQAAVSPTLTPGQVVVTPLAGSHINKCQGALPTPGSGNTDKRLTGGTLVPGGTAIFEISYPVDAADVGDTFTILDCVFIGGVETVAYEIEFVPNTTAFVFSFTLIIPTNATLGAQYCNVAKTTGGPSAPQASNRKAGPACFIIGGDLRVLKVDVSGASLAGATFEVTCVPPTVAPGTFLPPIIIEGVAQNTFTGVVNDGVITIAGPQGTVCTVTETIPPAGYELADPATQTGTIGTSQVTLTFVNRVATGDLVINKTTTGGTGTFTFVVNCTDNAFDQTVTIANTGSRTITGIPVGTSCTVTENAAPGFTSSVTTGSSPVTIASGSNIIGFTNVRNLGNLVINKTTTGGTGTFTFVVDCSDNAFDQTVTIVDSGSQTITGIPTGTTCTVVENAAPGFTSTVTTGSSPVTIGSSPVTIGFTNVRDTGSLVINKTTTGGTGTFTFVVDCSDNAFDQTVTIVNSGSQTITGIPTGTTCTVVENAAPGFTSTVTAGASPLTIGTGSNAIGFTNVRNTGSLVINKTTTGGTGTFTFVVDCSDNAFDQTVTIVNSGSQTITGIPTGTTCTVVETPDPEFSSSLTTGSSPLTIGSGTNTVGFTNTALLPTLAIVKTADAATVSSGSPIGFGVTVSNSGPGTARNVTLDDPLPPAVGVSWSISPAYSGPGTCSVTGTAPTQTLNCAFGDIAPGGSVSVHVASATTSATSGTLLNTAVTSADNHAPIDDDAQIVINRPGLSVAKVADATSVNSGSPIGFTVTVSNAGPGTATSVVLNDPLPAGTGINWSISPARAGCAITGAVGSQVLACTFGDMAAGATASVHVVSATTAATSGTFTNTATASASNHGPVTAIANVVVNKPNLSITKTADAASVTAGNPIGFTVTVANAGPGAANNLTVSDPLPGGVDVSWSISPATAGCSITATTTQTLTCTVASLASGASLTVHVVSNTTVNSVGTFNNVATTQADNHPAVSANATTAVVAPPVVLGVLIERVAPALIAPVVAPAVVEPAPAAAAVAAAAPAELPRTGGDPLRLLFAGLLLIAAGMRFRRWGRRA